MALFPLISNFQYDFVLQLLPVDTENTMDEVAAAAAHQRTVVFHKSLEGFPGEIQPVERRVAVLKSRH